MKDASATLASIAVTALALMSCGQKAKVDEAAAAPPPPQVVEKPDLDVIKVDQPERFKLVAASEHTELPQLHVTGVVNPDVGREVPVASLASGRVVGIYAKLGDDVKKGQLLLKLQSNDIATGFQALEQAKADEKLANTQLDRAQLLYGKGAISLNDLQVADDAAAKARVARISAQHQIRNLGADPDNPDPALVNVYAPVSGTIVEQNIAPAANVHTPDNQPNLFTIADLSKVWVTCDVYENDLPIVRLGDKADVQLNAYPDRTFQGRISNISKVLDPNIRTAKVRIEIPNSGIMRVGMFVTATFYGLHGRSYAVVPASAVLHLHDRDWVFVPAGNGQFRRVEITAGKILNGTQVVMSGIAPGEQIVSDALALNGESQQ